MTGLLTEHPHKNCETLAEVVPGTNAQQLNNLLTEMTWDEEDLNRQRVQFMSRLSTEGDGILLIDDTGFAKKGQHSVGVARQYSGTLGKTGNCQITVNCHYAEPTLAWPVNTRLYLPQKEWAQNPERRRQAHVPEEISFATKPEIGLGLLDQALAWAVPHAGVAADAGYGDNPPFLDGLEARQERYVAGVHKDFSVSASAKGPAEPAERLVAQLAHRQWRSITWREGSKGKLRARFAALRCWRVDGQGGRRVGWLIGQKPGRDQKAERKYFWSNFGPQVPLERMVEYAHRLHWIEQYHEEAKGELGWDQFQGRRWDGFHRNAVSVMLTYSFLVWLEWTERQKRVSRGRQRRPFSPSPRPPTSLLTQLAPQSSRLASAPSHPRAHRQTTHQNLYATIDLTE